jgi:RNA polymerase-binding transcription factor DksA
MAPTSKKTTKKTAAKKTAAKKTAAKKAPVKKAAVKKAPVKKAAVKKAPVKKAAVKKAPVKKAAVKKAAVKKAAVKKAAPKKSPYGKRFINAQTKLLHEERARYVTSAETLKAEADALVESREPGDAQFDEESGEGDTLAVERERDLALSAHARAAVDQIDGALKRIEAGIYGVCTDCGGTIPEERLEAIPWAALRVECKAGGLGRRR